jgi:hypothetical protein
VGQPLSPVILPRSSIFDGGAQPPSQSAAGHGCHQNNRSQHCQDLEQWRFKPLRQCRLRGRPLADRCGLGRCWRSGDAFSGSWFGWRSRGRRGRLSDLQWLSGAFGICKRRILYGNDCCLYQLFVSGSADRQVGRRRRLVFSRGLGQDLHMAIRTADRFAEQMVLHAQLAFAAGAFNEDGHTGSELGTLTIRKRGHNEKGDRPHWCEVPEGPFRQMGPVPFFGLAQR